MKKTLKRIFIILIVVTLFASFSYSYKALNIDALAFVVSLGIDVSETKDIKVTFQFVNPPSTNEGSNSETKIFQDTVDTNSIPNAINIMNSYLAKKIDLSHCRNIVFSEEIAKKGISEYIYTLINNVQVRPTSNLVVTTCSANEYIKNSIPSLETSITRFYDLFPSSGLYTGYVADSTIGNFYNSLVCNNCDPYAILGSVSSSSLTNEASNNSTDFSIKSGESSISGLRTTENIGIAAFKHDKLVGELNAIETVCFNILQNKLNSFLVSVPNPTDSTSNIDLMLTPKKPTKIKVDIINDSPYVKVDCNFSAKICSIDENSNYLSSEVIESISNSCSQYLEDALLKYLYKTSLDFKSDISDIGQYSLSNFATNSGFKCFNWAASFVNSGFDVNIETNIDSGFLLNET